MNITAISEVRVYALNRLAFTLDRHRRVGRYHPEEKRRDARRDVVHALVAADNVGALRCGEFDQVLGLLNGGHH